MDDFSSFDLVGIARGIRNKQFTSKSVTEWSLKQLKERGNNFNAIASLNEEGAINKAKELDKLLDKGHVMGELHGVPFAHKDLFEVSGQESYVGSRILKNRVTDKNAAVIELMNNAGQVNVGSLLMSEFALSPTGYNAHYGSGKNPWNPDYISGGSSSGSGIAVSDRMVFGSIGGDTGGSIRLPAAICGITGIKTTIGLYDSSGVVPLSESLDCFGPICQTAADCRVLLKSSVANESSSYQKLLKQENKNIVVGKRLTEIKVCVIRGVIEDITDLDIQESINSTEKSLKDLGVSIEYAAMPEDFLHKLNSLSSLVLSVEAAAIHRKWLTEQNNMYSDQVRSRIEQGYFYSAVRYAEALMLRKKMLQHFEEKILGDADFALLPSMGIKTPTLQLTTDNNDQSKALEVISQVGLLVRWINYLGLPALSMPCGFDSSGLPIGAQIVGRAYSELNLLALGEAYQKITNWHQIKPTHN